MSTPRIKVHETLGVLVQATPGAEWVWILNGEPQLGRMTEEFAARPGWVELTVSRP